MEVNFAKNPAAAPTTPAATVAPPPAETTATPPAEPTAPASAPATAPVSQCPACRPATSNFSLGPSGLVLGDKLPRFDEIILPRLNIVQNIGQLKDSFINGSLVLNQQLALFIPPAVNAKTGVTERPATPPAIITILGFRPTRYCEKIEGGVKGIIVNTEEEVRLAGGTLDYQEWKLKKDSGMKRFECLADAMVAVQRPELAADDDTVFNYEVGGQKYALALWAMRGTSYTAAAKRVFFTARATGCLRKEGYPSWAYAVTTREETYPGGNKAWIPVCLPCRRSTPEFIDFVRQVLNAPASEEASK